MSRVEWFARAASLPGYGRLEHFVQSRRYDEWLRKGRPMPPPSRVKQQQLRQLADENGLSILVETGTLLGSMLYSLRCDFRTIYSIELSESLYRHATRRFRQFPHIHLIHGDSGERLKALLPQLDAPTLFWLDGHYSGPGTAHGHEATPLMKELNALLDCPQPCVVAIDDARFLGNDPAYPTKEYIMTWLQAHRPEANLHEAFDTLILTGLKPAT